MEHGSGLREPEDAGIPASMVLLKQSLEDDALVSFDAAADAS